MRVISIDPGKASGVAIGEYEDDQPYTLSQVFVTHDGVEGFADAYWNGDLDHQFSSATDVVIERMVVRPNQPVDPIALEVIGFIKGVTIPSMRRMRLRSDKHFVPDSVLKEHGLWQTGKMVGHTDGRDANDAIIHAISWLAFKMNHRPTLNAYFPEKSS